MTNTFLKLKSSHEILIISETIFIINMIQIGFNFLFSTYHSDEYEGNICRHKLLVLSIYRLRLRRNLHKMMVYNTSFK
jgi:hypothetical protein